MLLVKQLIRWFNRENNMKEEYHLIICVICNSDCFSINRKKYFLR